MSDYQAIYDAVRSRISCGNVGDAVAEAIREANISHYVECAMTVVGYEATKAAEHHSRPSAVYRPSLSIDGNQWCALYGPNLAEGLCAFGETPDAAMRAFDVAWATERTPTPRMSADGGKDIPL